MSHTPVCATRSWCCTELSKFRANARETFYTSSEAWLNRKRPTDMRNALRSYFQLTTRGQNQRLSNTPLPVSRQTSDGEQSPTKIRKKKNTHTQQPEKDSVRCRAVCCCFFSRLFPPFSKGGVIAHSTCAFVHSTFAITYKKYRANKNTQNKHTHN